MNKYLVFLTFFILACFSFIGFIMGMINPSKVVFWKNEKARGSVCIYLFATIIFAFAPLYSEMGYLTTIFLILFISAFTAFIIGMIKPSIVVFLGKKTRGFVCLYLVAMMFSLVGMGCSFDSHSFDTDSVPVTSSSQVKISNETSEFAKTISTTEEQSRVVKDILKKCGVKNIETIKHDEILDDTDSEGERGYRINTDELNNIILYLNKDGGVQSVRYADHNLFLGGKVYATVYDFVLTDDEESDLLIRCQHGIESILKSPSTAKFPNILHWAFAKNPDRILVQSYVDSQNSFGATIRSEFQVTFTPDGNDITSLIVNGVEYIK